MKKIIICFFVIITSFPVLSFGNCDDLEKRANEIFEKLKKVAVTNKNLKGNPQINFKCSQNYDAFVDVEDKITISLGFMMPPLNFSEEEFAAIIAHELGHIINETSDERLSRMIGWDVGDNKKRSVYAEDEADIIGLKLLNLAGYSPTAMLRVFLKEKRLWGNNHDNDYHRSINKRLRFIRRQIRKLDNTFISILSKNAKKLVGKRAKNDGPNCFNAVMISSGATKIQEFVSPEAYQAWLANVGSTIETPTPGSIITFYSFSEDSPLYPEPQHGMIYLGDDYVFEKENLRRESPYRIVKYPEALHSYLVQYGEIPSEYGLIHGRKILKSAEACKAILGSFINGIRIRKCGFIEIRLPNTRLMNN